MENFIKSINYEIKKDSNEEYHSKKEYVSASGLKLLKKSPLHFMNAEKKSTDAMDFGSMYHTFVLENELFYDEYFVFDDSEIISQLLGEGSKNPRATNKYKEWNEGQINLASGKKLVDKITIRMLEKMKDRLTGHKYCKSLINNGEAEMSVYCEIEIYTGQKINVKIRPDYMKRKKRLISDLKTTNDATIEFFPRNAAEFGYHIQAALYTMIMEAIEGLGLRWNFLFIAQEKTNPYAFNIFESSPQFISQGNYEVEQLLQLYAYCQENNFWPGYQVWTQNKFGVNELNLPGYAIRDLSYYFHKF